MELDSFFDDGPYAARSASADHRPRQAGYVVTIMVLTLVVAGLAAAYIRSDRAVVAWQATAERRSADLATAEQQRESLRRHLVEANQALDDSKATIAETSAQLDRANAQVKTLTAEKAAMLDPETFMPVAIAMSTELAQAVGACASILQPPPIAAIAPGAPPTREEPGPTTPEAVTVAAPETGAVVEATVQGVNPCDRALADSEAFTKWLDAQ